MVHKVRLFGVVHDLNQGAIQLMPSSEMMQEFGKFPQGTVVGIEGFPKGDVERIRTNFLTRAREQGFLKARYIPSSYWNVFWDICEWQKYRPVCLGSEELIFQAQDALFHMERCKAKARELGDFRTAGSLEHHLKLVGLNEEAFRADLEFQRLTLVERDRHMLQAIASSKGDVAIVGRGHADNWFSRIPHVARELGVEFVNYCVDDFVQDGPAISTLFEGHRSMSCTFRRNPADSVLAPFSEFQSIARYSTFLKTGKFGTKTPDWVGTWDVTTPSRGYFELFVESGQPDNCSGGIHDGSGNARFDGKVLPGEVRFTKKYTAGREIAISTDVAYLSSFTSDNGDKMCGEFSYCSNPFHSLAVGGGSFYIEKYAGRSLDQMACSWFQLKQAEKARR